MFRPVSIGIPRAASKSRLFVGFLVASTLATLTVGAVANADGGSASGGMGIVGHPEGHAPISVMGDHLHKKGEWMLSYRFMFMDMDGNRDGTQRVSDNDVLFPPGDPDTFPVAPTKMDMEMHMLGVMYGATDRITLMAMMPFARLDMDHRTRMGARFRTRSQGIGDLKLTVLVGLYDHSAGDVRHKFHLNAGISVPTGNDHNRDRTPLGTVRLPYPMQIGSGTVDLLPGLTYNGRYRHTTFGAQASGIIRLGRNSRDYRRGHGLQVQGWAAQRLTSWLSSSFRLGFVRFGNYGGSDGALNPNLVPTADTSRRAYRRLDLGVGLNFIIPKGALAGNRFAVEWVRPVWQETLGPQLETDWVITAGWQLAFAPGH